MLTALKNNERIEHLSLELLRLSLSGDDLDYWETYDSLISLFGYCRILENRKFKIIRQHQQQNYTKYQQLMKQKISKIDQLQKSQMKRYWQSQIRDSDQFLFSENLYYCTLSPVNFILNLEIHKHKDFKFSPYAFVSEDTVIYSNTCAQKKGILQGLPVILAQKIDPQTKLIQLNKHMRTKWSQIFQILTQKYKSVQLIDQRGEIHFVLRQENKLGNEDRKILQEQLNIMIEDIFSISGVRMAGIVSRSEMVCQLVAKSINMGEIAHNFSQQPIILLSKPEIRTYLDSLNISVLPSISASQIRFLSSMNISTIKQLLQNLYLLQVIFSKQQTIIIMQSCLGLDYRDDKWYIEQKQNQYQQLGLAYQQYTKKQETASNTIEGLNIKRNVHQSKQREKLMKMQQESDLQSVKSERVNNNLQFKQGAKQSKSQANYKPTVLVGKQQQSLAGFVKKTTKK